MPGLLLLICFGACAHAQSLASVFPVAGQEIRAVRAGKVDDIPLQLDPSGTGDDLLHVMFGDASLKISLLLPGGAVVDATNAREMGYDWERASSTGVQTGNFPLTGIEGEHVLIGLPTGSARGKYVVRVDATSARADANVTVEVILSSNLSATVSVPWDRYSVNEMVKISGAVMEETQVLKNPTMKLEVVHTHSVSLGLTISNTRLLSTEALPGGGYRHRFTADLVSRDVSAPAVIATAKSERGEFEFLEAALTFQTVKAGATSTTPATISVRTESSVAPLTAEWRWTFEASQPPVSVPLLDSGESDATPGDGVFTGSFVPTKPGRYSAVLTATGANRFGVGYKRVAVTNFQVVAESGSVLGCTDRAWDDDGNGLIDRLTVTMQVRVAQESDYRLQLELADSLDHRATSSVFVRLQAGDSDVPMNFWALNLRRDLPGNSPYRGVRAQIWLVDGYQQQLLTNATCGQTAEYPLSSFELEPVRLAGTPTLLPVDQNGVPGFEHLDYTQDVLVKYERCQWSAELGAADGTMLDRAYGGSVWKGGTGKFTARFSGTKIARSGKSGPYRVTSVRVSCGELSAYQSNAVASAKYSASDFENTPADFSVSVANVSSQAGVPATAVIATKSIGEFEGDIVTSVSSLPAGWTATSLRPQSYVGVNSGIKIVPAGNADVGTYSLTLTATSGNLTHTQPLTVTITALPVTVTIQPTYATLHPGQSRQFTAQVENTTDHTHTWRGAMRGTLKEGLYQAPVVIESAARDYVFAVSNLDGAKYAHAFIDLLPPAIVVLTPATVTLHAGESAKLRASVTNVESPQVIWTMDPHVGTLVQTNPVAARYFAPSAVTTTQTLVVTATSVEDPSQSATMSITLQP